MSDPTPAPTETIADDDLCPICHLLILSPVLTQCAHILCASCMAQWADTSTSTTPLTATPLLDLTATYTPSLSASCPMCRTQTTAHPSPTLAATLAQKYPTTYALRAAEEEQDILAQRSNETGAESIVLLIGNKHRIERRSDDGNTHDWTFFVRVSRPEMVKEVRVYLHPTFRPPVVTLREPPFEVRRLGWGTFNIRVAVVLESWFVWDAGSDAVGRELALEWMLDFEGRGMQRRVRAKVRRVEGEDGESVSRRTRNAVRRVQAMGDGDGEFEV
ncbi:unnamed protein product [Periconia digitata]|uniref:Protein AF-9 homolog n=1 Tax=Periconia digitata TaxID=1303443 RepID=A0A9W4U1A1_9PLEO|nr:unnamed protein product [Periconia digitata]